MHKVESRISQRITLIWLLNAARFYLTKIYDGSGLYVLLVTNLKVVYYVLVNKLVYVICYVKKK